MPATLACNDVANEINVEEPGTVRNAVRQMFERRYPGASFEMLNGVFDDFHRLFTGRMPGYAACDTLYHDMRHTLDMTLATARLIDGHDRIMPACSRLGPERALLGVITALHHDCGYLREAGDTALNGAQYTTVHVARSARYLARYLTQLGLGNRVDIAAGIVHFTGNEVPVEDIVLDSRLDRRLGYILGSADLIAQMSDRAYLEKCRDFLYQEFVLGGIARQRLDDGTVRVNYESPEDLLRKTIRFHDTVADGRLNGAFEGVHRFARAHFGDDNPYQTAMHRHIDYLRDLANTGRFSQLRRESVSLSAANV